MFSALVSKKFSLLLAVALAGSGIFVAWRNSHNSRIIAIAEGAQTPPGDPTSLETGWQTSFSSLADCSLPTPREYPAWEVDRNRTNPVFDWRGGVVEQTGAGSSAVHRHIGWNEDPNTLAMEFQTDAPRWELLCAPTGQGWRVMVRDVSQSQWQTVGSWKSPPSNSVLVQDFHQKDDLRMMRRWRVEYSGQLALGVRLSSNETISAAKPTPPLKRVVWCGDSFVEGVGTLSTWQGFAARAGALLNVDSHFDASGGTGYVSTGPPQWHRSPYGDRLANIVQVNPAMVVIYGSTNDAKYPPQDVAVAARRFWSAIRQALPRAKIVVIGPIRPNDNWKLEPWIDALQNAAKEDGLSFVDASSWIHGTGSVAQPRGDGDADTFISADGVHPSPTGHAYLAQKTAEVLRPLLNETG